MATTAAKKFFYSQSPELKQAALTPALPIPDADKRTATQKAIASTYNRVGGLISSIASKLSASPAGVISVFYVESGGKALTPDQAVIRFEVHLLYRLWGSKHKAEFDQHFQFGGHNGIPGKAFENHKFRETPAGPFSAVHKGQASEYRVLALARQIAGDEIAIQCISIGGCQILCSNFSMLGYATAREMYDAFQADEHAHVLGFFDFCAQKPAPKVGGLLSHLKNRKWDSFARYYNGAGQVPTYTRLLTNAFKVAQGFSQIPGSK